MIAGNYLVVDLAVQEIPGWKESIPDMILSTASSMSTSSVVQVDTLSWFLKQWKSINLNRCASYG